MSDFGGDPGSHPPGGTLGPDRTAIGPVSDRPRAHGSPHGRRSSWVLVAVAVAAFATGGVALILHLWWLFWVCVAIDVLAIPAGKAVRIMDDTVSWETSAALAGDDTSPPAGETAPPAGEGATGPPEPRYQG